jgi:hypothetical protein
MILPTPIYSANSLRATVLSNVAKFPDGDLIGFQVFSVSPSFHSFKSTGITVNFPSFPHSAPSQFAFGSWEDAMA